MDQGDAEDLIQLSRAQLGYAESKKRFPRKETLHYVYSRHINTGIAVDDILRDEYSQFVDYHDDFLKIFADYTRRKGERNLVDYDDLLLFWATMLEAAPSIAERIASLYDHVLVDEYQDTNVLQARILRGMCRRHSNITVVGDDAQSIYSFRGASFRNILDFPRQFPGTTIIALEQNYRSTQPILDASNTLISRASERYTKTLWTKRSGGEAPWLVTAQDEQQQTRFVVDRILELHEEGVPLREIAVLFRAGYMRTVSPAENDVGTTASSRGGGVAVARNRAVAVGSSGRKASTIDVSSAVPSLSPTLAVPSKPATAMVSIIVVPVSAPRTTRNFTIAPGTGVPFASVALALSGCAITLPAGADWSFPSVTARATACGGEAVGGSSCLPHARADTSEHAATNEMAGADKEVLTECRTIT